MRFSSTLLALPALAAAEGGFFGEYKAQFQNILGQLGVAPATDGAAGSAPAAAAAAGSAAAASAVTEPLRSTEALTLNGWKETLYAPVQPTATTPEEWWVLVTGGNKTCFGHCGTVEAAFNATATKLNSKVVGPHTALLDCDAQPVLCNAWSASPGYLYVFDVLPEPAKTDIYYKRLNLTTTKAETIEALYDTTRESKVLVHEDVPGAPAVGSPASPSFRLLDGYFHPLDGLLAVNGLAIPLGYLLWFFSVVPNWLFMVGVSFISRTVMGRRLPGGPGAPGRAPGAAAAQ